MPGFRPNRRCKPLTATPHGCLPPPSRGYNPLYPTRIEPAPGTVPGSD
jgi:hypothetical protein